MKPGPYGPFPYSPIIRRPRLDWPGDVLTCSAVVTGKREVAGEGLVDCEFSAVNQNGDVIIRGDATAALPR